MAPPTDEGVPQQRAAEHDALGPANSRSPPSGSNRRPRPYQGRALPTELGGRTLFYENSIAFNRGSGRPDSNRRRSAWKADALPTELHPRAMRKLVEGDGFEPSKAMPADLQSAPFGHSGNPPGNHFYTDKLCVAGSPAGDAITETRGCKDLVDVPGSRVRELATGLEPVTPCLQGRCSTS